MSYNVRVYIVKGVSKVTNETVCFAETTSRDVAMEVAKLGIMESPMISCYEKKIKFWKWTSYRHLYDLEF